jgi:hypothetical protein
MNQVKKEGGKRTREEHEEHDSQVKSRRTQGGKGHHSRSKILVLTQISQFVDLYHKNPKERGKLRKGERENERGEGDGPHPI